MDDLNKSVREYLQLPSHKKVGLAFKIGYPTKEVWDSSDRENDNKFFKWCKENNKVNEFIKEFFPESAYGIAIPPAPSQPGSIANMMFSGSNPLGNKEAELLNKALEKSSSDKPTKLSQPPSVEERAEAKPIRNLTIDELNDEGRRKAHQLDYWNDLFDIESVCRLNDLSEIYKWSIMSNRYVLTPRTTSRASEIQALQEEVALLEEREAQLKKMIEESISQTEAFKNAANQALDKAESVKEKYSNLYKAYHELLEAKQQLQQENKRMGLALEKIIHHKESGGFNKWHETIVSIAKEAHPTHQ